VTVRPRVRARAILPALCYALPAAVAACSAGDANRACTRDSECKGARVCVQGGCLDPTPSASVSAGATSSSATGGSSFTKCPASVEPADATDLPQPCEEVKPPAPYTCPQKPGPIYECYSDGTYKAAGYGQFLTGPDPNKCANVCTWPVGTVTFWYPKYASSGSKGLDGLGCKSSEGKFSSAVLDGHCGVPCGKWQHWDLQGQLAPITAETSEHQFIDFGGGPCKSSPTGMECPQCP
jgi:hypothetical protein